MSNPLFLRRLIAISIIFFVLTLFLFDIKKPSLEREWNADQELFAKAHIDELNGMVHITHIRNFTYYSTVNYTPSYYDATYDLNDLRKVYFMVEPFSSNKGAAHTLVSFEFAPKPNTLSNQARYVAISAEIRKEKGESFSAIKGLFKSYELMYVIADERDVIDLRANHRNDTVYLYPMRVEQHDARALFISMLRRANALSKDPEFYNTATNTCTTNIVRHINEISPKRVPFDVRVLAPSYSDEFAYELGLIDTNLTFEEAREHFKINSRSKEHIKYADFSSRIRMYGIDLSVPTAP